MPPVAEARSCKPPKVDLPIFSDAERIVGRVIRRLRRQLPDVRETELIRLCAHQTGFSERHVWRTHARLNTKIAEIRRLSNLIIAGRHSVDQIIDDRLL